MDLDDKIKELEELIEFRDNNQEWLRADRKDGFDTNEYHWFHLGESCFYRGKLSALKELRSEWK